MQIASVELRLLSTLLMVVTMRTHWSGLRHRPHGTAVAVVTSFLQIAAVWETLGARIGRLCPGCLGKIAAEGSEGIMLIL